MDATWLYPDASSQWGGGGGGGGTRETMQGLIRQVNWKIKRDLPVS